MANRREAAQRRPVESWVDEPRIDALEKVTGRAKYIEDLPDLPGTVYAAALRSPYSHARIVSVDASRAERLPGVLGAVTRECLGELDLAGIGAEGGGGPAGRGTVRDQTFITTDKARFDGDLLGMVAAVDLRTARRAVELVNVEYEILPTVFSVAEALSAGAPLVHEDLSTNLALEDSLEWGDVAQGFHQADRIFEETYFAPNVFHHPMEPSVSFVAYFANECADLWVSCNSPFNAVNQAAKLFRIKPENVRVRVPYIGGGFGAKGVTPEMMVALALSRKIGRPVKLLASGEESFRVTARHAMAYKAKMGVRSDGTLVALDVELEVDTGAYFTGARVATHNAVISAWGCYRIPHFRVHARTAYTNKVPASHFRATGKTQTTFAIECMMDSVAQQLGYDPIEFRQKNVVPRGQYIADKWRVRGEESAADTPPMDTDFDELLQKAVEAIHWDGRATVHSGETRDRPRSARGRGVALSLRHGSQGGGRAYAMATLASDGIVTISHNAADLGQGVHTIICIVASRTLGIPQSQVRVGTPDTSNDLPFAGTNAQRTTVQIGSAVQAACENLKRELIDAAVQAKGGTPSEWKLEAGRLLRAERSFSFTDIVRVFEGGVKLKGIGSYSYTPSTDKAFGGLDHWAPGVAAAEVEVDRETGEVHVLQLSAVADAGKVLHYLSGKRQVEGGAIMGLGLGLFEELHYRDGQLRNADAFQYRLPLMGDLPQSFQSLIVENGDGPGPFGAKGMAQTSIPCVAPAIGNAICDAVGVRVRSTPITPEKVLRALGILRKQGADS